MKDGESANLVEKMIDMSLSKLHQCTIDAYLFAFLLLISWIGGSIGFWAAAQKLQMAATAEMAGKAQMAAATAVATAGVGAKMAAATAETATMTVAGRKEMV